MGIVASSEGAVLGRRHLSPLVVVGLMEQRGSASERMQFISHKSERSHTFSGPEDYYLRGKRYFSILDTYLALHPVGSPILSAYTHIHLTRRKGSSTPSEDASYNILSFLFL